MKKKVIHKKKLDGLDYISEEAEGIESIWKKKKNQEKLKRCQKEKEEYRNQLLRTQADFVNYRKRQEQNNQVETNRIKGEIITVFLPLLDSLRKASEKEEKIIPIKEQLENILKRLGLEKIKTIGEKFDYNLHEVVGQVESNKEEGAIVEEVQTGYSLDGKILRPSKVLIVKIKN